MVEHKTHERNHVAENVKLNFIIRVVDVYHLLDSLEYCFDSAQNERWKDNTIKVDVFLSSLYVMEKDSSLVDVVNTFLLGDIWEPEIELSVFSHSLLQLFLWTKNSSWLLALLFRHRLRGTLLRFLSLLWLWLGTDSNQKILVHSVISKYGIPKLLAIRIGIVWPDIVSTYHPWLTLRSLEQIYLTLDNAMLNKIEFYFTHYNLICQWVLYRQRIVHVITRTKNVRLVILRVQQRLVLLVQDRLKEVDIWLH